MYFIRFGCFFKKNLVVEILKGVATLNSGVLASEVVGTISLSSADGSVFLCLSATINFSARLKQYMHVVVPA